MLPPETGCELFLAALGLSVLAAGQFIKAARTGERNNSYLQQPTLHRISPTCNGSVESSGDQTAKGVAQRTGSRDQRTR